MTHMHECPNCGVTWECGEANYQDECPYPTRVLCLKCWSLAAGHSPSRKNAVEPALMEKKN